MATLMGSRLWRLWYGLFAWHTERRGAHFRCMNWGYSEPDETAIEHDERYPLQLHRRVVAGVELTGRRLVEVSCGRGGGLAWLHQTYGPAQTVGVDFTPANVKVCRASFADVPGLRFEVGRAEDLPLEDSSVDVVISVEASHCYDDVERFLAECKRVLRPGGTLRWADFRPIDEMPAVRAQAERHLRLEREDDLTAGVVRALQLDRGRRERLIDRASPRLLVRLMGAFAGSDPESITQRSLADGSWRYFLFGLRA